MSKTKTKRARRELKRDEARKLAAHHRKSTTNAKPSPSTSQSSKPKPTGTQSTPRSSKKSAASSSTTAAASSSKNPDSTPKPQQASQKPPIPFGTYSPILLVGEGDFTFARSLAIEHGCANVTATSYDGEAEVLDKYPSFAGVRAELRELAPPVPLFHGIDAARLSSYKELRAPEVEGDGEEDGAAKGGSGWDTIAFMFPHTGGLSTDVNRQVRANQALLVSFFEACLETNGKKRKRDSEKRVRREFLKTGGRVIVTLFEGEPYTLWNVRDLARHAGLKVVESFRFDWADYPGYKHVRTLGEIEGGGAWKGEDREARMYVFEKVPVEPDSADERAKKNKKKGKKRPRDDSDSEED
ncbi:hypothetical protein BS50DRAFT_273728 [Corynespora cassiicola Philippines]|uniref:25S rRNA (uridine-N(3))-methyltransferase BMT5-like domain-containing protein n=1 Tax=Corynespora cassiicola Philippines TaxID=1448308 RepID=A0A2T2P0A9_CORCC|nr:hypothetical protein BS50DRAFT_273728 [Corynespora cassiicola Philippines]